MPAPIENAQEQAHDMSEQGGQPPQEGGADATKAIMGVRDAIQAIGAGLEGQLPPEAMDALQQAAQAYDKFLQLAGSALGVEGMGAPKEPVGQQDAMMAGSR